METDKLFIRHGIRYEFHQAKSVRKACESICSVLGDNIVSKSTCEYWYKRFQNGDFDVSDRERADAGAPVKVGDRTNCKRCWMKTLARRKNNLQHSLELLNKLFPIA